MHRNFYASSFWNTSFKEEFDYNNGYPLRYDEGYLIQEGYFHAVLNEEPHVVTTSKWKLVPSHWKILHLRQTTGFA